MELTEMGLYLFFTCIFATLLQHPASPIRHLLPNAIVRRACFGISIGATIVAIVLTPWGKQSGGHLNPAMTFTFYRLGKVEFWDAIFYGVAQFRRRDRGRGYGQCSIARCAGERNNSLRRDTSRHVRAWCRVSSPKWPFRLL
jgi:hypothetical protein